MGRSFFWTLLLSTLPWMTLFWVLRILFDSTSFIILLIVSLVIALVYQCHIYPVYTSPFRSLSTPQSRSYWLGNHSWPVRLIGRELPRLCTESLGKHLVRYYTFFSVELIFVLSPEAISELCLQKSGDFSHSGTIELLAEAGLGYSGLLAARGQAHKGLRKLFSPVFTPGTLVTISHPLWESCLAMVRQIDQRTTTIQIGQWTSRSVLELSGICVFGQERDWLARYPGFLESLERRVATGQIKKIVLSTFPRAIRSLLMLTLFGRKELADLRYVETVARDLAQLEKQKLLTAINPSPNNLISVMLQDGALSDDQIVGHILIFLVGASATTSAAFQWMLLELCRFPAVQSRLREELQSYGHVLSITGSSISAMESLPYLRAVVDELLRLHPTVVMTEHEATKDTTIMDTPVPKGTLLLCPPLATNLNPQIWGEDASEFNPGRWLPEGTGGQNARMQHPCANMTFSHGPRSCPGRSIARLMLTCLTAAFIRHYQVSLDDPEQAYVPTEAVYAKPMPDIAVRLVKVT
ncbi:cytochrome P450 [Aspergillus pseudotamarii]|uniref:Cytochrome P450 n=1 Tax=Aspergillus pseudotamarii TaxID=132259 RepID=A0A5N6T1W4_ASPPS|nr:cytochrome P450 [Aspergillus pseudotamarii]KAE8140281.1 cytochrome P450 [Aspergillus pseudotamarii]